MANRCVYFMFQKDKHDRTNQSYCRIGSTHKNPNDCATELQECNPDILYIYKTLNTNFFREWERYLHFILKFNCIRGEWFKLSTTDVDNLCEQYMPYMKVSPPFFTLKI